MDTTKAVTTAEERRAARRAALPDTLTMNQLRQRSTTRMRFLVSQLAEDTLEEAKEWLDIIAATEGPKVAFTLWLQMLEFALPKLSRAEVAVDDTRKTRKADLTMEDLKDIIREARTFDGEAKDVTPNPKNTDDA